MSIYDNKELLNSVDRLLIKIKQDGKAINSFKLTDLLQQFASSYYKSDLLNSISKALISGVNPKNIVIFDRDINYKHNDYNFDSYILSQNIYDLYKLGAPISLIPNIKIYELNFVFKLYFQLNSIVHHLDESQFFKSYERHHGIYWLENYYQSFKSQDFVPTVNKMVGTVIAQIPVEFQGIIDIVREQEDYTIKKYKNFINGLTEINKIIKGLKSEEITDFGESENYFTDFFRIFQKLKRPVVAVYQPEDESFDFLCSYHYNYQEDNPLLLKIDKVTHHSPYDVYIEVAATIAAPLLIYLLSQHSGKKQSTEKRLSDLLKTIKQLYSKNNLVNTDKITPKYFSRKVEELKENTNMEFYNSFVNNSLGLIDIENVF